MSFVAMCLINSFGVPYMVSINGVSTTDFLGISCNNAYGITLVGLYEEHHERVELGTDSYYESRAFLSALYDRSLRIWTSIDSSYPIPNALKQDLSEALEVTSFASRTVFGRMYCNKTADAFSGFQEFYDGYVAEITRFREATESAFASRTEPPRRLLRYRTWAIFTRV